jgi:pimeloyl-ACP methyl ester carboxylesterase
MEILLLLQHILHLLAAYTPPTNSFDDPRVHYKSIKVVVTDPNNISFGTIEVPIQLHKVPIVPIVLIHGLWENQNNTWIETNFKATLEKYSYRVYTADYAFHNAETFDPYAVSKIGNYGIESINKTISNIIKIYNLQAIADSQVDVVGHSMGGLMARGYIQQAYYKNENNYMEGYVHRLITIGTPHDGAPLAKILHDFSDAKYCYNSYSGTFTSDLDLCPTVFPNIHILSLRTIYDNEYNI